jgi:hypothetical protein
MSKKNPFTVRVGHNGIGIAQGLSDEEKLKQLQENLVEVEIQKAWEIENLGMMTVETHQRRTRAACELSQFGKGKESK